jgi:DNA-binding transcriptional ArsR family regulator
VEPVREITDADTLRVLAHPLRQRILRTLRREPATSARLARELGENTGATSYHLRQLAQHGFIEELPGRGHGRERWWRAPWQDLRYPPRSEQAAEMRNVLDELNRRMVDEDLRLFAGFQTELSGAPEWADIPYSRGTIRVDREGLAEFFHEYLELLQRYAHRPESPGARTMLTRFLAFPEPFEQQESAGEGADQDSR